ncbi:guanine nucleotide-binding protein beta, putative, partial [Pediculus humanus corporis]
FHPSGQAFASASDDKTARIYDIRSDQQLALFEEPKKTSGFSSCGLSLSGRFIFAGGDDNNIHMWDALKNQHRGHLSGHESRITSLSVSTNGMSIVSSSWDQNCRVWA